MASKSPVLGTCVSLSWSWCEAGQPPSLQSEVHPQVWPAVSEVTSLRSRLSSSWCDFILPWQRRGNSGVSWRRCRPFFVLPRIQSKVKQLTQKNDNCIPRLPGNGSATLILATSPGLALAPEAQQFESEKRWCSGEKKTGSWNKSLGKLRLWDQSQSILTNSDKLWRRNNYSPIIFNNRDRDHHMLLMSRGPNTKYHEWKLDHAITQIGLKTIKYFQNWDESSLSTFVLSSK